MNICRNLMLQHIKEQIKPNSNKCSTCGITYVKYDTEVICPECGEINTDDICDATNLFQENPYIQIQYRHLMAFLNNCNNNLLRKGWQPFTDKTIQNTYSLYNQYVLSQNIIKRSSRKIKLLFLYLYLSSYKYDELRQNFIYQSFFNQKKITITSAVNEMEKITGTSWSDIANFTYEKLIISMLNNLILYDCNFFPTPEGIFSCPYKNTIYMCVIEIYKKIEDLKIATGIRLESLLAGIIIYVIISSKILNFEIKKDSLLYISGTTLKKVEVILQDYKSRFIEICMNYDISIV